MTATFLLCAVWCLAAFAAFYHIEKHGAKNSTFFKSAAVLMIVSAVALRVFFALRNYSFEYDINTFKAWGSYANSLGYKNLYGSDLFLDYPPGYIYVLSLLDGVCSLAGIALNTTAATAVFKLPSILADFAVGYLLYRFALDSGRGKDCAVFVMLCWLLMPAAIHNSSVWGQIESFYLLFVLLSFYFAGRDKTIFAAVCFAYALIIKLQAVMFGPVLLLWTIKRGSIKEAVKAVVCGAASFYLMALPFCKTPFDIAWLAQRYVKTVNGYQYFTVNGYNLYSFLGLNWQPMEQGGVLALVNPVVVCCAVAAAGIIVLKSRKYTGFYTAAAVTVGVIFAFCTMMHERYLFPAAGMCLFAFAATGKKTMLCAAAGFGSLNFINSAWVMSVYFGPFAVSDSAAGYVGLITALFCTAFAVWAVYNTVTESKKCPLKNS